MGVSARVLGVFCALLVGGCGGQHAADPATSLDPPSAGGTSAGGATATGGAGGASAGGAAAATGGGAAASGGAVSSGAAATGGDGGGGDGGATPVRCASVDGALAYGPIGDPRPLPLEGVSGGSCATCGTVGQIVGFRTAAGYGFLLSAGTDASAPAPNLFTLTVDSDLGGGEPRALPAENPAFDLDLVPAPDGWLATTCSAESEPEWLHLDGDLVAAPAPNFVAPAVPCERFAPSVVWTGEGYLTSFTDSRGLMVALLDDRGAVVGEEVLSERSEDAKKVRFAKNGARVLCVFAGERSWFAVLDVQGRLVGEVQPFGEADSNPLDFALAVDGAGWQVVTSVASITVERGVRLTRISEDGLAGPERRLFGGGYTLFYGFTPSAYGGFLLSGTLDEGGQYGLQHRFLARFDDAGEIDYFDDTRVDEATSWPLATIHDPLRDLVVESSRLEGSEGMVAVQEYGCLDGLE